MNDFEEIRAPKIEKLLTWLKNNQPSTNGTVNESAKPFFDVDLFYGFVAVFKDISSSSNFLSICKHLYDGYVSGDEHFRYLVTLLIPTMVMTYLKNAHQELSFEKRASSSETSSKSSSDLDALSFLLFKLCQLTPTICHSLFESFTPDVLPFSTPFACSIFHNEQSCDLYSLPCYSPRTSFNSNFLNQPNPNIENPIRHSIIVSSCLLRVYSDTLLQGVSNKSREIRFCTMLSLKTFHECVQRSISFDNRPRIVCTPHFLNSLINSIDSLLFLLNFDKDFHLSDSRYRFMLDAYSRQLRPILFNLLYKIERMAVYQCFSAVILFCSSVRSMWISRFKRMPSYSTASERSVRFDRPVSFDLSEKSLEEVDYLNHEEISEPVGESSLSHTQSFIRNASFKPECVPEDIPINPNLPVKSINNIIFSEHLTRSLNNISTLDHSTDPDSGNVRRSRDSGQFSLKFWQKS